MQSLISIIIPCYNDWQYVEQAVNSALNQTYSNIEVIVVDDGSNIKTKEILRRLESKITKLITQENQGQSKARNVGIEASNGDYVLVLDSDDYFESTFCEKAISFFFKNDLVKIVTCQAVLLYEDGSKDFFTPKGGSIINFMYCNDALGTSMFKKVDWLASGGYDESMRNGFEDWEFFIRILKREGIVEVIHEPLYNYRRQNTSTTTVANSKKYELLKYIYLKHEELYKNNFESFVTYILSRIEREELEKMKNLERIEYKIGKIIVKPFRLLKTIFK